jgi:26S proteasome regulatory subunit N2
MNFGQKYLNPSEKCIPFLLYPKTYEFNFSEKLYENEKFPNRQLAALIASRVYYHLNEFDDSLQFALGAGKLFDVNKKDDEYIDKIVSKCIDSYIEQRSKGETNIDPRLQV